MILRPGLIPFLTVFTLLVPADAVFAATEHTYLIILGQPGEISADFPARPPASPRQVGFGVLLYTLSTTGPNLRRQTEDALNKSETT